jgi:hypothetical protein
MPGGCSDILTRLWLADFTANPRGPGSRGDLSLELSVVAAVADCVDEGGFTLFDLLDGSFEHGF